jgi:Arc/MetJ-type ribon-helix-helix transcriptional regulator
MRQQISLRLPEDLLHELDGRAKRERRSRSEVIREVLEQHLCGSKSADHPYGRIRDLLGSVAGGPPDMGARPRKYLVESLRDRRD